MMWQNLVLHATALAVVGFFVAFAAQKTTGRLATFGRYLSYWLYFLAAASVVLGALFIHRHGGVMMMGRPGGPWAMHHTGPFPAPETPGPVAPSQPPQ